MEILILQVVKKSVKLIGNKNQLIEAQNTVSSIEMIKIVTRRLSFINLKL